MNIPLYKVMTDEEDIQAVTKVVQRGMGWTNGPEVEELEKMVANYVGTTFCLTFNSGTSALHAMLLAYGIGSGDNIIVPSFTFIATANSALFVNARPKFADIEKHTFGLSSLDVQKKVDGNTKAIMPIHYGGTTCDIFALKQIAEENKVLLLEDAAEAIGAKFQGKKAGSIGDASIISFCGNKVMTTGEGGAVLTNSRELYDKLKLIRSHGRNDVQNYFTTSESLDYVQLGYNWRISSITAAIGLSQMKKIDKLISLRRQAARTLSNKLSKFKWIKTPQEMPEHCDVYQMYTIQLSTPAIREKLRTFLSKKGITCKVYFDPVHKSNFYREKLGYGESLRNTEEISGRVLTLPIFPSITGEEIDYIAETISAFEETEKLG